MVPISLAIFALGCLSFASAFDDQTGKSFDDFDLDKRLYDYAQGRKPHHYVSEYKRLPLYNFGLGKRFPRYDFGLGKRNQDEEDLADEYDDYPFADEEDIDAEAYLEDEPRFPEKRQRRYSFGLGKRLPKYDFGLGKRAGPYDFGLGKRAQRFNFGLGKRTVPYSFGLGKKSSDYLGNRYSFGLGKRDFDSEDGSYLEKREAKNVEEFAAKNETSGHSSADLKDVHEVDKRSKNSIPAPGNVYRRFRKPYNFGLGKRRPLYNFGLGKRDYQPESNSLFKKK